MRRQAKTIAISAAPIKNGRYGSRAVRLPIQATLNPSATKTSGPRQQVDDSSAVILPARRAPEPAFLLPLWFSAIAAAQPGWVGFDFLRTNYTPLLPTESKKKQK